MSSSRKKYKIIIMGAYHPTLDDLVSSFKNIKVEYYIKDESVNDNGLFEKFWEQYGAEKACLEEEYLNNVDMIFVCGYTKIIRSNLLDKFVFVNIHAGNLPKWRGTSANSWAIINGDYHIAYTLHRVTDILDGGPVYRKFMYTLNDDEKYGDGRKRLENMLEESLESVFCDICSGRLKAEIQTGKYTYCNSFRKDDGIIHDWNIETRKVIDLFRVFGAPYGSGLFFYHQEKRFEIIDISKDEEFVDYYCTPGAVVYSYNGCVWIKTKDNVIKVIKIKDENGKIVRAADVFRIGNRLC